jgi:3-methyladenine DNA glycosylase AlkD
MIMLDKLKKELKNKAKPERAKASMRYFKTGKGEYGEGDIFMGVTLPEQHRIAKKYKNLSLSDLNKLLTSKIHEHRLVALDILVHKYNRADEENKKRLVKFYLKNTKRVNNWDLVDGSAPRILGKYLLDKDKSILYKLARSRNLWERRISIIATATFIWNNKLDDTMKISEILLNDDNDLIYKAVGWMLREVGKRSLKKEESFLKKHYHKMPRTMLRYAIEKFPEKRRQSYLKRKI